MLKNLRPYITLIKENHDFRRLWLAQSVSNFGDWFGLLALYAIIGKYSDSEFLLGLIIVVKMVSLAFFSPIAGYFADRFNRRRLMIWCDVFRGAAVLGIILVQSPAMLWLAYVLTAFQMMLSAIFEPAKTSSIPNVTSEENLTNANIISTASWSIIFTTGMAIGGFATDWLGTDMVLILDALTYLVSAWFVYRATIPQKRLSEAEMYRTRNPYKGIKEGLSYLFKNRHILRPTLAKGTATIFLGGLVYLLIIVSEEVLMMGSIGLGLLYSARGIGTGIGPIIGRRLFSEEKDWVMVMGLAITFCGMMYMMVGVVNSMVLMLIFVLLAHCASGANWVTSTVLLQKRTQDTFRGRVFSTEWFLFTIGSSISTIIASLILESGLMTVKPLIMVYGGIMALGGIFWTFTITKNEREYQEGLRISSA
ncbi:MAG: MFS transporter [Balneolaceae bacterium]